MEPYKQGFLQPGKDSYEYLKDCSYKVNLKGKVSLPNFANHLTIDLYELKSTCYYNCKMKYCPVLVRVSDGLYPKFYDKRFLLQVWD